jgi:thiol-disulfide isomerase/thioredoxin
MRAAGDDEKGAWGPRLIRWGGMAILLVALGVAVRGPSTSLTVGSVSPQLRLATMDGQRVDLGSYRGRPMLINFFATWCAPCRVEIPVLNKLHASLRDEMAVAGVLVFSGLPGADVQEQVAGLGPVYPVWVSDDETAADWKVSAVPVSILLDGKGVVRWVNNGVVDESDVRDALKALRLTTAER